MYLNGIQINSFTKSCSAKQDCQLFVQKQSLFYEMDFKLVGAN